jgi:hypothetical protein
MILFPGSFRIPTPGNPRGLGYPGGLPLEAKMSRPRTRRAAETSPDNVGSTSGTRVSEAGDCWIACIAPFIAVLPPQANSPDYGMRARETTESEEVPCGDNQPRSGERRKPMALVKAGKARPRWLWRRFKASPAAPAWPCLTTSRSGAVGALFVHSSHFFFEMNKAATMPAAMIAQPMTKSFPKPFRVFAAVLPISWMIMSARAKEVVAKRRAAIRNCLD